MVMVRSMGYSRDWMLEDEGEEGSSAAVDKARPGFWCTGMRALDSGRSSRVMAKGVGIGEGGGVGEVIGGGGVLGPAASNGEVVGCG